MRSDALALYPKITKLHKQVWFAGGETHRIWVDLNMFYSSTWFLEVQGFPLNISKKLHLKKTQCGLKKMLRLDSAKCLEGYRLATDATLFEESCALSLSKGNSGLGPQWMRKLHDNSGVSMEASMQCYWWCPWVVDVFLSDHWLQWFSRVPRSGLCSKCRHCVEPSKMKASRIHVWLFHPTKTWKKSCSIHFDGMSEQNQTLSVLKHVASIIDRYVMICDIQWDFELCGHAISCGYFN